VETATEKAGFSEGFNSDNIGYDWQGFLIFFKRCKFVRPYRSFGVDITSRDYEKGLISTLMNNKAFYQMAENRSPIFFSKNLLVQCNTFQLICRYLTRKEKPRVISMFHILPEKAFSKKSLLLFWLL
jgi:hypothetical protein